MAPPSSKTAWPADKTVIRPLTPADLDASVAVENAAFTHPEHRASRDKIAYRLATCPELSLGCFVSVGQEEAGQPPLVVPDGPGADADGYVLVAHIIGTRLHGPVVTDTSMAYPADWAAAGSGSGSGSGCKEAIGHQPDATTVGIHSLGVVPAAQARGVGTRMMQTYFQRMASEAVVGQPCVKRVALICQDYLVGYYEKLGLTVVGPSVAEFGGGGWYDMIKEI